MDNDSFEKLQINDPLLRLNRDLIIKQFGDKFFMLRNIINKHDPIGLINIGAPEDEYDPEVGTILVQLFEKTTGQEPLELVYTEFLRWFNDESTIGPKHAYKELAQEIFEWKEKQQL